MFLFLWWFKIQELCFSDRGSFSIFFSLSFPVFFSSCQMYLLFNFFWFCSDILCCLHARMHVYVESCILYIFKGRGLVITPTPKYNKNGFIWYTGRKKLREWLSLSPLPWCHLSAAPICWKISGENLFVNKYSSF